MAGGRNSAFSYKIPEEVRQNSIIPRSYIQIRVAKSPAFYSYLGKEGNTVLAIDHAIQSCINQGYLMEVDKPTSEGEALEAMEQERDEAQNPDAPEYQADAPADAVVTTGKPKKEPKPKIVRVEQNGVKRPAPGGLCAAVWEWLDENGNCMPKDLKPVAEAKGWNLNNAQIELYQWRKFSGIAGRQAKAPK